MFLNIIWFILIVVLFCGYIILDGFDMGVGMTFFKAKTDEERRSMLNSIAPVWDGNEVWLITAGGAIFAAFPHVYATVFSGFYTAFMLFLTVLIGRAVSIEFRSQVNNPTWKKVWDYVLLISSYLIVLLLGVSLGNIISGVPVATDKEFAGSFLGLLHPFAILCGLTAIALLRLHGSLYLILKLDGELKDRFLKSMSKSFIIFVILYLILHIWTLISYPLVMKNYSTNPLWFIVPVLCIASIVMLPIMLKKGKYMPAFIFSSLIIAMSITMAGIGIFPNLLISNPIPANSLNIFNAASSEKTLLNMFIIACIGVPLVLIYSFIIFKVFKGKVKADTSHY